MALYSGNKNFGWTPLMQAVIHGDISFVRKLIAEGADLEAKAKNGDTALIIASRNNQREASILLIVHGAQIDKYGKEGWFNFLNSGYYHRSA
ncbi:ANK domain containing protein [uncultured Caudovirales phage]|uniref:ANK domain containing protein n=1 Tax=uncultured Caudovirales phage TaxID=2100421 RepID=A0A6J5SF06_9CAUD|nr:ANK domain containing protein [uncultured Caudovirales phage]CAB5228138.1 ANK domain containing protein [uncultured Caudovirales phage]